MKSTAALVKATAATALVVAATLRAPAEAPRTFCNPLNLDYAYTPIPVCAEHGKHRATADPVIVRFRGEYWLFATNQWGYWHSPDMARWTFVPRKFLKPGATVYDDLCAPAAFVRDDALYLVGSTYTPDFPIYKSTDPERNAWTKATPAFAAGAWDPAFLLDDDGRLYLYHGSGNDKPLWGQEVDPQDFSLKGERRDLLRLDPAQHGWERFGEGHDNTWLKPFIEGAWMTKHAGKYYLQYGAPGTEFSGYADGVYVGDAPLGPFEYQAHNPFSAKPGGFARGAGHGSTFQDQYGQWWHASTMTIAVKNNFERRIGIWPAGFDAEGVLSCDTAYGDYPTLLPNGASADHRGSRFAGWMLLNYTKPVKVSSTLGGYAPNLAVDEDIRTYWSAASGDSGEWIESDLGAVSTVHALQINYADQDATIMGKQPGLHHQYVLKASTDGETWTTVVDKSANSADVPHDYVELAKPVEARFFRLENVHVPTGKFAISGLRLFGRGHGAKPAPVEAFEVLRSRSESRNAWLKWIGGDDATGYVIYWGIEPEKLYLSMMVYGASDAWQRMLDRDRTYYFAIEAFNENGISPRSEVVASPPEPGE